MTKIEWELKRFKGWWRQSGIGQFIGEVMVMILMSALFGSFYLIAAADHAQNMGF